MNDWWVYEWGKNYFWGGRWDGFEMIFFFFFCFGITRPIFLSLMGIRVKEWLGLVKENSEVESVIRWNFDLGRRLLNIKSQVNESLKEGRMVPWETYNYAILLFGIKVNLLNIVKRFCCEDFCWGWRLSNGLKFEKGLWWRQKENFRLDVARRYCTAIKS